MSSKNIGTSPIKISSPVKYSYLIKNAFTKEEIQQYETKLHQLPWKMQEIKFENEVMKLRRETIGMSNNEEFIHNTSTFAIIYPEIIIQLRLKIIKIMKKYIDKKLNPVLNYCWGNRYRDGNDDIEKHKDEDDFHIKEDPIVSVSFGSNRNFDIFNNRDRVHRLDLGAGDILVMLDGFQEIYYHSVPKQEGITEPRINLTFRSLKKPPIVS